MPQRDQQEHRDHVRLPSHKIPYDTALGQRPMPQQGQGGRGKPLSMLAYSLVDDPRLDCGQRKMAADIGKVLDVAELAAEFGGRAPAIGTGDPTRVTLHTHGRIEHNPCCSLATCSQNMRSSQAPGNNGKRRSPSTDLRYTTVGVPTGVRVRLQEKN